MSESVLKYVGLNVNRISRNIKATKPEYNTAKVFDNSVLYKVYKRIPIKSLEILISDTDRTTDVKERYENSIPIDKYIRENKDTITKMSENTSIEAIQELEELQKSFETQTPFFIKYDKNYIWQIYYSKSENKYFMLFPSKEGETEVLFYLIKEKIKNEDKYIYVPICKENYSESIISNEKIKDIENYLWMFTTEWPQIYEVFDENEKPEIYITGRIVIQNDFKTSYRIKLKDNTDAEERYTLLKALFIIMTETKYIYKFSPQIDTKGELIFTYGNKEINITNMKEFTSKQTAIQQNKKYELKRLIDDRKATLDKIKKIIEEQNEVYSNQEKQIAMFMNCRKNFFKRVRYFFTNNKKYVINNKKTIEKIEKEVEDVKIEDNNSLDIENYDILEISNMFTISDLVKTTIEAKQQEDLFNEINSDIKALKIKQKNMKHKIENAQIYLDEIESQKKSWLGFWKFTNKDNESVLMEGRGEEPIDKRTITFNLNDDFEEFAVDIDSIQRKKLSNEEFDAIFVAKHLLPGINSVITRSDTYILDEEYELLKKEYNGSDSKKTIFGNYEDDSTKIKFINNKIFRENKKNLYQILRFNEYTSLDDFKERMRTISSLVNEAYQKLTAKYNMTIYYGKRNKGYIIGDIDPYKVLQDKEVKKIYKMNTSSETHIIYLSNTMFYDNNNKTLPLGMDESTEIITKVGENRKISDCNVNLLIEKDLFNIEIRKIKLIEEGKRN
ncbi:MAG: hypothetical protein IKG14_05350 [Clostridia bacterium]|nr:hypothetical protein [Clostridia bacterium]